MTGANPYLNDVRSLASRCESLYDTVVADPGAGSGGLAALARGLFDASQILTNAIAAAKSRPAEPAGAPGGDADDLLATADTLDARPAAVADAADVPEEEPAIEVLAAAMATLGEIAEAGHLVIDSADLRFAQKAGGVLAEMDEAQRSGGKAARLLVDCVRFMDVLDHEYVAPGYDALHAAVVELRAKAAVILDEQFQVRLLPDPREDGAESPGSLGALDGAKRVKFPSSNPAGAPLGLLKRGIAAGGKTEPPEILVSFGSTTPAFELINRIAHAILRPINVPREVRQGRALAFKEIRAKYLPQLIGADGDHEATVIRYVANLLQPLNKDDSLGEMVKRLVAELAERGIKQIPVRVGTMFDDSYGTTKFERKMISSDKPKGTIAQVIQLGFVNRDGVPVQKAILGVSGGPAL